MDSSFIQLFILYLKRNRIHQSATSSFMPLQSSDRSCSYYSVMYNIGEETPLIGLVASVESQNRNKIKSVHEQQNIVKTSSRTLLLSSGKLASSQLTAPCWPVRRLLCVNIFTQFFDEHSHPKKVYCTHLEILTSLRLSLDWKLQVTLKNRSPQSNYTWKVGKTNIEADIFLLFCFSRKKFSGRRHLARTISVSISSESSETRVSKVGRSDGSLFQQLLIMEYLIGGKK